jgi:hypothetical protein
MEDKSIIKIAEVTGMSWEGDWDQPWTPADELWQYFGDASFNLGEVSLLKTEVKMKQIVDKDD